MRIIESYIMGKHGELDTCEDAIVINEKFIAVIDGVTSKGKHLWNGKSNGKRASEIIKESFFAFSGEETAEEVFSYLSRQLAKTYAKELGTKITTEYLRACVIVYSRYWNQIWSYGDCQCIINNKLYRQEKMVDQMNSMVRSFVLQHYLKMGYSIQQLMEHDFGRDAILPFLQMQFEFENQESEFGYAVLNGEGINKDLIRTYQIIRGDEVILASDGYPELFHTLDKSEARLRTILSDDPMGISIHRTTKGLTPGNISFDDRAYIRFIV